MAAFAPDVKRCTLHSAFALAAVFLGSCTSPQDFDHLYNYYFPKNAKDLRGVYRDSYDRLFFSGRPGSGNLSAALHGDPAGAHSFFHDPNRDGAGEFGETWSMNCALLLIRLGDNRFSDLLAREDRRTREMVGSSIDCNINFKKHHFPKTRALYYFRWGPREGQTPPPGGYSRSPDVKVNAAAVTAASTLPRCASAIWRVPPTPSF